MGKRNPRARWILPEVVDPPDRICYTVAVPNERQHIAAFKGALLNLASATQWADDEAHTAKQVALVWRDIFDNLCSHEPGEGGDCCMDEPCTDVNIPFDPDLDGRFTMHVIGGMFNVAPTYVRPGDVLTLIGASGVWRDGMLFVTDQSNWYRFDGGDYTDILTPAPTSATDILTEIPHMALIGRFDDDGTPYYWQLGAEFGGAVSITIPSSVDAGGVIFELFANGPFLSDSAYDLENFQPHGELCVVLEILRTCAQIFIDFESGSLSLFELILGTIVESSPIGEGAALESSEESPTAVEARIKIPLPGCGVEDYAFTYYRDEPTAVASSLYHWIARDEVGGIISSGFGPLSAGAGVVASLTVTVGLSSVFELELFWVTHFFTAETPTIFIDNVFVN